MYVMNESGFANRAGWRTAVQRCLGIGVDPFEPHAWADPRDMTLALRSLCASGLSSAFVPGGGRHDFVDAEPLGGRALRLDTIEDCMHTMLMSQLDYVPHPIDPADAVFRLELQPVAPLSRGPVSSDGFRQAVVRPHGKSSVPWPDRRWLHGVFVFVAQSGLFNRMDPNFDCWDVTSAEELGQGLAGMSHAERWDGKPFYSGQPCALQVLAESPLAAGLPPGWTDVWLETLPYGMPNSTIHAAASHVVNEFLCMPGFHQFRDLCERVTEDLCLN